MAKFPDLPPEIQDMILTHALRLFTGSDLPPELQGSLYLPNMHYKIRAYRKRNDGRELALVCKRWAAFVHSRVFRNVYLRRPEKLGSEVRFMQKSTGIKRFCSELDVGLGHVSQRNWWGYVRNIWGYLSSLPVDEEDGGTGVGLSPGRGGRRKGKGVKLELRGALKRPYRRVRQKPSGGGREGCAELPTVNAVDTLVWGIGVGIEDEEWTSRDSTASIWQKHHPEPWRLSMVLESLPNLRHLTVLVPDSFGEETSFHEQLAVEIANWPTTITKLNFEYQRKRPTNRVREPVHQRGIEKALSDGFKALVTRFSPHLEDLYWSGRVSLDLLQDECVRNAKWPKLKKIRIDFGNYDLHGNWFFDLQRRRPVPWDPERSEGDESFDDWFEGGSSGSWETDHDMDDDIEHNAGATQYISHHDAEIEEFLNEHYDTPTAQQQPQQEPQQEHPPAPSLLWQSSQQNRAENAEMMDAEVAEAAVEDVMMEYEHRDAESDDEYMPLPPEVMDALDNVNTSHGAGTFDNSDDDEEGGMSGVPVPVFPPPPLPYSDDEGEVDDEDSEILDPDPENEWTARYCYNRSKPRKEPLDKLHKLIFGWTRNIPNLRHMLIISDSERSEGNVQLRVTDRRRCLVFYSTEGNAYWPDQKCLDESWARDQWDEVKVEACEDAWGTCEVNLRFSPDMLNFEDD